MKGERKKTKRLERQERLLRMFEGDFYQEFDAGKCIFVKQWNGDNGRWQVAIYTPDSFRRYKRPTETQSQQAHLRSIMKEEF